MIRTETPDPEKFPAPHTWATFIPSRAEFFKTHSSFHVVKSSVRSSLSVQGANWRGAWVYRWDGENEEWTPVHFIEHKDPDHPDTKAFFAVKISSKRAIKGPTDKQVEAALASIAAVGTESP